MQLKYIKQESEDSKLWFLYIKSDLYSVCGKSISLFISLKQLYSKMILIHKDRYQRLNGLTRKRRCFREYYVFDLDCSIKYQNIIGHATLLMENIINDIGFHKTWEIIVPRWFGVNITIVAFDIPYVYWECNAFQFVISDETKVLKTLCGRLPSQSVYTKHNKLTTMNITELICT